MESSSNSTRVLWTPACRVWTALSGTRLAASADSNFLVCHLVTYYYFPTMFSCWHCRVQLQLFFSTVLRHVFFLYRFVNKCSFNHVLMWETASWKYPKSLQPEMKDENGDDVHTITIHLKMYIQKENKIIFENNYYDSLHFRFVT